MENERRHKNWLTKLSEVSNLAQILLIAALLIQVGEYKANFKNLQTAFCEKMVEIKTIIDANAAESKADRIELHREINVTRDIIAAHTGSPAR
jgi:hypothetical protein